MTTLSPPIFVINLARHSERRAFMEMQLNAIGLDFEVFAAVDGRLLTSEELAKSYDAELALTTLGRDLTPGEIGCALSHLAVYRKIIADDLPFALIFEDDALIGSQFPDVCERVLQMMDPLASETVLFIHAQKYSNWRSRAINKTHKLVPAVDAYCAHGYLVTQAAAKKMLATLYPVHNVADCWNYLMKSKIIKVMAVVPYCIGHAPFSKNSAIEPDRSKTQTKQRQPFRPLKYFYTKIVYQLLIKPVLRIRKQESTW